MINITRIETLSRLKREMVQKQIDSKTHEDKIRYGKRFHEIQREMTKLLMFR